MHVQVLALGGKAPAWVQQGVDEYLKRCRRPLRLTIQELAAHKRSANASVAQIRQREAETLRAALPRDARVVALDERGQCCSTADLAERLRHWDGDGRPVAMLIGGADGLDPALRAESDWVWSLSPLTFPHALVRVLLAEQIYRAWSLLQGHPYHRE